MSILHCYVKNGRYRYDEICRFLKRERDSMKSFKRHITKWEKFALSVIVILLLVSVVEQTFYGGETFLFMVVMLMCLLIMSFLLFCPNKYKFDENALIFIYPKPLKNKIINYSVKTRG